MKCSWRHPLQLRHVIGQPVALRAGQRTHAVQHGGQPRGLRGAELMRRSAEVVARRGFGAAQAPPPRRVRQIKLQHAGLAQRLLHLDGIEQLAYRAALAAGDQQLGELLRQRAGAAGAGFSSPGGLESAAVMSSYELDSVG